ncbi:MAG: FHA domain-containing protein, partial [Gemmataceae bacterium]|nr:FHA domain-containing protein [Gemmataceae bacterium]
FTLVGRDESCDVTLSDPDINPRHAWLQVLGGRVFALDLGSRTGLVWPGGGRGSGWLDSGTTVKVGPFLLRLNGSGHTSPRLNAPDGNPLAPDAGAKARLTVALEFRNGRRAKDKWAVNRLVTLVGRSPDCKIHLTADDISLYHCGLISTPSGLWVVDLSGRGVVVNGERMRVAPLPHGSELWVGRFLIGCHQPLPSASSVNLTGARPPGAQAGGSDRGVANSSSSTKNVRPAPKPAPPSDDEEVELGGPLPPSEEMPSSHILAEAFRQWGPPPPTAGPPSQTITVSHPPDARGDVRGDELARALRQMADLHARGAAEFDQWLALLDQTFAATRREHLAVVQHELTRIEALTAEIAAVQSEVT